MLPIDKGRDKSLETHDRHSHRVATTTVKIMMTFPSASPLYAIELITPGVFAKSYRSYRIHAFVDDVMCLLFTYVCLNMVH